MPTEHKIQILIVDDHEMVRCGLKTLLAGTEIKVVAEAATGQAAIKLILEKEVDLVLLDVRMPDGDGLAVLGRIKLDKPKLPVLLFSAFDNSASIARAIALGATGFLLKGCTRDELLNTIRAAVAGESIWNRERLRSASRALRTPRFASTLEVSLSERESEVLRQMAQGLTNKQIAVAMNVSYETVKEHVQHIFRKIGLTDRTQTAVWAVRNNLV
ncbi:MAG: response regulator transcription factor [Thermoguttaceae bacterium]|jgi:DNA-binding NarL/FixJ family response regulator